MYQMLDYNKLARDQVSRLCERDQENPNTINGFDGEFAFSDHKLVPESLRDFLVESYPRKESFWKIPLNEINSLLNAAWQGPGSLPRIRMYTVQLKEISRNGAPVAPVTDTTTPEEFMAARRHHSREDLPDDD